MLPSSRMSELDAAKRALSEGDFGLPKVSALVEAMFLAATSDGELAPEESLQFCATLEVLTDKRYPPETVQQMMDRLAALVRKEGRQARLAAIAQRIPDEKTRETALILAAAITASDGKVHEAENDLLADLAEALRITPERTVELVTRVHRLE
jgi:tellurite resistance protein